MKTYSQIKQEEVPRYLAAYRRCPLCNRFVKTTIYEALGNLYVQCKRCGFEIACLGVKD